MSKEETGCSKKNEEAMEMKELSREELEMVSGGAAIQVHIGDSIGQTNFNRNQASSSGGAVFSYDDAGGTDNTTVDCVDYPGGSI